MGVAFADEFASAFVTRSIVVGAVDCREPISFDRVHAAEVISGRLDRSGKPGFLTALKVAVRPIVIPRVCERCRPCTPFKRYAPVRDGEHSP